MPESDPNERLKLTPEQRRFLGGSRSANPPPASEQKAPPPKPASKPAPPASPTPPRPPEPSQVPEQRAPRRGRGGSFKRVLEIQRLALIAGGLVLIAATFYVGKKFEYWRYLITTRNEAKLQPRSTALLQASQTRNWLSTR